MFGLGAMFEHIDHAIKECDVQLLSAMLLPVMGFYSHMQKRNLSRQCFWQTILFITGDEQSVLTQMTALTTNRSGEPHQGDSSDHALESDIGVTKGQKTGKHTVKRVTRLTSIGGPNAKLREDWREAFGGPKRSGAHSTSRAAEIRDTIAGLWDESGAYYVPEDSDGNLVPRRLKDFKSDLIAHGHTISDRDKCLLNFLGPAQTSAQPLLQMAVSFYRKMRYEIGDCCADLAENADVVTEGAEGSAGTSVGTVTCDLCCQEVDGTPFVCPACVGTGNGNTTCNRASCVSVPDMGGEDLVCRNCAVANGGAAACLREELGCDARDGIDWDVIDWDAACEAEI